MLRVVDSSQIDQISSNIMLEAGHWPRVFTAEGIHPFEQIEWKIVDARIEGKGGNVVFEQKGVEVPIWWGQSAINIVADKLIANPSPNIKPASSTYVAINPNFDKKSTVGSGDLFFMEQVKQQK